MNSRKFIIAGFLISLVAAATPARADLLQKMFPYIFGHEETGPRPENTLQAPFSDAKPDTVKTPIANLYNANPAGGETADLATPHRHQKDIGDWLVPALSEILALDPNDYAKHLDLMGHALDAKAMNDFKNFIQTSNVIPTLQGNNMLLHCYVEEQPLLLNEGAVDGRYRWLFDTAITLTFLPRDAKTYADTAPVNQHILLRTQVGRVPHGQGVNELMIESFEVRANPDEK